METGSTTPITPASVDWKLLAELRENFLSESPAAGGDYWRGGRALEDYDRTFARRIGWKWDAVLAEISLRGWNPGEEKPWIVDWGCGTGVATRKLLELWPSGFAGVQLIDRSPAAVAFAAEKARPLTAGPVPEGAPFVLVMSHVANEIDDDAERAIERLVRVARSVLWVEPGTKEIGKKLVGYREKWRGSLHLVAPCPHEAACGLTTPANERHWCHHFAEPPQEVFHSAFWAEFARRLHIDLRSLPVSYLVLDRGPELSKRGGARVIGRPRHHKGFSQYLGCDESGVSERKIKEREDVEALGKLRQSRFATFLP